VQRRKEGQSITLPCVRLDIGQRTNQPADGGTVKNDEKAQRKNTKKAKHKKGPKEVQKAEPKMRRGGAQGSHGGGGQNTN